MEIFETKAKVEKLQSKQTGKEYIAVKILLSKEPEYIATYFPKDAEKVIINKSDLINDSNNDNQSVDFNDFA